MNKEMYKKQIERHRDNKQITRSLGKIDCKTVRHIRILNITSGVSTYLIFVIFFTRAKFLENKIYTEKRVNYDKLHSKLPILRVNYDKLHSKLPIFRVKSVKIYTGQCFFTQTLSVVSVTNIRYGMGLWHRAYAFPSNLIYPMLESWA